MTAVLSFLAGLGGVLHAHATPSTVTRIAVDNGSLTVVASGHPAWTTASYTLRGTHVFVLALDDSTLEEASRPLAYPALAGATVEAAQFSTSPNVVHVVLRYRGPVRLLAEEKELGGGLEELRVAPRRSRPPKVFLDVGHGGYDPGGVGPDRLPESTVNLSVARRVAAALRGHGISVELDRTSDRYVDLARRVKLADSSGADLFIGLYCNASPDPSIRGTTTYYLHPDAREFAQALEESVAGGTGLANDGIRKDNLYVINHTSQRMIDVLIEYGYISNRLDERLLATAEFRARVAESVARSVETYFRRSGGAPVWTADEAESASGGPVAHLMSLDATNAEVKVYSEGRPQVQSYRVGDESAYVVAFSDSILDGPARSFEVGPPVGARLLLSQYSVDPDVVHLTFRTTTLAPVHTELDPLGGDRYVTVVYPAED